MRTIREKLAGRFGRTEHRAGRIIVAPIIATIILIYTELYTEALIVSIITLILWAVYIISHSVEKKLYGPGRRR
jgi:hypothetical protein